MDGTIIGQGIFTSNATGLTNPNPGSAVLSQANPTIIQVPSAADWVKVYNYAAWGSHGTNAAYFNGTGNAYVGTDFYWQRGLPTGYTLAHYNANTTSVVNADVITTGGITIYDPTGQSAGSQPVLGSAVATTASTNATRPVVSTANTAGISVGTVVRLSNTAQTDVNGIDMVVGAVTANTNFTLLTSTNALATAPGAIGGAGFYRIVNASSLYYPRRRYITNITQSTNAQVSTSVAHGLTPGQAVRFNIPTVSGMTQLNSNSANNYSVATIVSVVDDYNFTINVDTTAFTAFTFPTIAQQPSSFPEVTPVGEDTASALLSNTAQVPTIGGSQIYNTNTGILADSTVNTGYFGLVLGSGGNGSALTTPILGPAGYVLWNTDNTINTQSIIYWVAGKSTYGGL